MLNADKTQNWKNDTLDSIDYYNDWFLRFAPLTYREQRKVKKDEVERAFVVTEYLRKLTIEVMVKHPEILSVLRMCAAPPIAQDRLAGLAYSKKSLIATMEGDGGRSPSLPAKMTDAERESQLAKLLDVFNEMMDVDIFPWTVEDRLPTNDEYKMGVSIVTDRLCGSAADPIIRNAQEARQLHALAVFLKHLGYQEVASSQIKKMLGKQTHFVLFLCGYFDAGYLGYEAAEGIDWVWEHRIHDFLGLDLAQKDAGEDAPKETALAYRVVSASDQEAERFRRQKEVDASKSLSERNANGQYSTPFELAHVMVGQALRDRHWQSGDGAVHVFEPACGSGVFLSALLAIPHAPAFLFTGVERDPDYAGICKSVFASKNVRIVEGDFFIVSETEAFQASADVLVANPPYVRHHHLAFEDKLRLQSRVLRELGIQISGLSGLYVYFILLADRLLRSGAVASWLIPGEFLYTNYGKALREYLLNRVTLLRLHTFASEDVQFDDALVSSCIVTYRKAPPPADAEFEVTEGRYGASGFGRKWRCAELSSFSKWVFKEQSETGKSQGVTVGDLFRVTRGIATGNNGFFVLDEEHVLMVGIERDALTPLLPGPRFLRDAVIDADDQGEPQIEKRRYLLSLDAQPEEVERRYPRAYQYLQEGERAGVPSGGLCKMRKLWYQQEKREPPKYLVSYMGRANPVTGQSVRFFLNRSKGIATNGFICLYPRPFLVDLLSGRPDRETELLACLNAVPPGHVDAAGRQYGGGLKKIEPRELSVMTVEKLPDWLCMSDQQQELFGCDKS
ncbi:MAG TPA: XamI family restriction endonuclease [Kiritimatiellia bacterium]|nr:XamI family restriction endonuclease [Kiritimatiellia bacterium]HPK37995.1 XamI family restriction endonuclease [Kiritimatiellia bacterium]